MSNILYPETNPNQPMIYQIRIIGHLDRRWRDWFEGMSITLEDNGETLITGPITKGREESESVSQIATFTGQAFRIPEDASPILVFDDRYTNFLPEVAWEFDGTTERYNVEGMCQGAYLKFGKGRVVAFGEAAMFSAQLAGPEKRKMGMNNPVAPENYQLLLNIVHWLDGKMD